MIYYVDVDDTLVRTIGSKIIPITGTIQWMRSLDLSKDRIYLWSRGGDVYAKSIADRLGIADLISAYLPKPDVLVDDQELADWNHLRQLHPGQLGSVQGPGLTSH